MRGLDEHAPGRQVTSAGGGGGGWLECGAVVAAWSR